VPHSIQRALALDTGSPDPHARSVRPVVFRFGRLGDMVLLSPLLHRLRMRFKQACVLVGPEGWSAEIYQGHSDVDAVWTIRNRHRPSILSASSKNVAAALKTEVGPIYVCETEPRALAKIRWILVRADVPAGRVVYISDQPLLVNEHWVDRLLRFAQQTPAAFASALPPVETLEQAAYIRAPHLHLSRHDHADRDEWILRRGFGDRPIVLIQPANRRSLRWNGLRKPSQDDKFWPVENWRRVIHSVHASIPNAVLLLCGSPAEEKMLESMRREIACACVAVAASDLPVRRLMALLNVAHSMLSVDTGPAHLAAAIGCPLVVLFGRSAPLHWLPRSPSGSAVIPIGGAPDYVRADQIDAERMLSAWRISAQL
jgi:ADP-heptose:LPS heptosyltransferase